MGENEEASIDVPGTVETRLIPSYQQVCEVQAFTNCKKEETQDWKKHIFLVDKLRPLLFHDKSPYKISLTVEHFVHMFGSCKGKSRWQNIDEKADAIFHHKKLVQTLFWNFKSSIVLSLHLLIFLFSRPAQHEDQMEYENGRHQDKKADKGKQGRKGDQLELHGPCFPVDLEWNKAGPIQEVCQSDKEISKATRDMFKAKRRNIRLQFPYSGHISKLSFK